MSHPATIHDPMTVPEASKRIFALESAVADEVAASPLVRAAIARIATAFRSAQFIPAARWLIRLNADTVGLWGDEQPEPDGHYWWRGRTLDDDLQLLAEAFGELTMGITAPYWEIDLPEEPSGQW